MAIAIDISTPSSARISEQVTFIKRAEELGFSGVGIADHADYGHDAFVALATAAAQTSRIQLYPAVMNPITRNWFILASAANSLAELAPGRIKLTVATGDAGMDQTASTMVDPQKLAKLREAVVNTRKALRGLAVSFDGGPPRSIQDPVRPTPPVAVAASGPQTIELAGEVADEALISVGVDHGLVKAAFGHLATGAKRSGRNPFDIPVTFYTMVSIDSDKNTALERARYWLYSWLHHGAYAGRLEQLGLSSRTLQKPADIPAQMLELFADKFFIIGSPEQAAYRVEELMDQGIEHVFCMLPGGPNLHARTMEMMGEYVLPRVL